MPAFQLLAPLKFLRGTPLDIFGYGAERRLERGLITEYEATLDALLGTLGVDTLVLAAGIAGLPEGIRGYGPIKARSVAAARKRQAELIQEMAVAHALSARPATNAR
jgi:indolepyruvate ferredoxin oxidoreductase